jgi:hypothetical protein
MPKSQTDKLEDLLLDYLPHRTDQILSVVYGGSHLGISRIGARIGDLRKRGHNIPNATRDNCHKTLYWYRIIPPVAVEIPKENWHKKIYKFDCSICGKEKETKVPDRAVSKVCTTCERSNTDENQLTIF